MSRWISDDLVTVVTGWSNAMQHFQDAAHDLQIAFAGLIGIGIDADPDSRHVARLRQLGPQESGASGLEKTLSKSRAGDRPR